MRTLIAVLLLTASAVSAAAGELEIRILSGRPDMVTAGDALVQVSGFGSDSLQVELNGRDVTGSFRPGASPLHWIGRIAGVRLGKNVLRVRAGENSAALELVNYPRTGSVFSGPHQEPFACATEQAGLGKPLDEHCSVRTRAEYYYRSTDPVDPQRRGNARSPIPAGFKPLDPSAPRPADIETFTTTDGRSAQFIVRVETGTINRAIYQVAFLHDPSDPLPNPWSRGGNWNGRLVYRFGGGCRAGFRQGAVRTALQDSRAIQKGYAVAVSSLNVFGNNCNDVLSAETMMMVKEHFIESFGVPVHTIGVGGSGGSMQQHLIAQNYPGLLDGITPGASYPDSATLSGPITDCSLLARAFADGSHTWSAGQKQAVSGYATWQTCESWMRSYSPSVLQPGSCAPAVPKDLVYHPIRRPDGVRCGSHDNIVNLVGRDPETGLARRALDNTGVQYGLRAFQDGQISAEQFIELNEAIGGYDADGNIVPERTAADVESLRVVYRKGRVNLGGGSLGSIPIIDTRRYRDRTGNIHDSVRTLMTGRRLERANGTSANRVVLTDAPQSLDVVDLMDRWLDAVAADPTGDPPATVISRSRPAGLADACWTSGGERLDDEPTGSGGGTCGKLFPASGDPRIAAGAPLAGDILKCALKPVGPADYARPLTSDQLERLKDAFPDGVCDYSRPGIGQEGLEGTWLRY